MNLLVKLVTVPLLIWVVDVFTPFVEFNNMIPYITLGVAIGGLGWTSDYLIMPRISNVPGVLLDGALAALFFWLSPFMFPGSSITGAGILLLTALVMAEEYILHRTLVLTDQAEYME